jgi:signal transduction histidine kinase
MLLTGLSPRLATSIRVVGLVLIIVSVLTSDHAPRASGRGLVVAVCLVACAVAWLVWMTRPTGNRRITPELAVMAVAGGALVGASPNGGSSAFVFVAIITAGLQAELASVFVLIAVAVLALGIAFLAYKGSALGLLAYALGLLASELAASNGRQARQRANQAELLLAQTQRSHEEHLRAARLEESTRLAREIHDVLAHTLAGLTIQLEATASLVEHGAERDDVLARVQRAHALAKQGLQETRQAVGALRGEPVLAPGALEALVAEYRSSAEAPVELAIDGEPSRLTGPTGQTVLRVVQEALTNVRKHAPGARVSIDVHAGAHPGDEIVVIVDDEPIAGATTAAPNGLASSGGGFGLQGMRERAQLLGGTLNAGPAAAGWRVELHLPTARSKDAA